MKNVLKGVLLAGLAFTSVSLSQAAPALEAPLALTAPAPASSGWFSRHNVAFGANLSQTWVSPLRSDWFIDKDNPIILTDDAEQKKMQPPHEEFQIEEGEDGKIEAIAGMWFYIHVDKKRGVKIRFDENDTKTHRKMQLNFKDSQGRSAKIVITQKWKGRYPSR